MEPRRLHVAKVPTTASKLFPYTHYADEGHDPRIQAKNVSGRLVLECTDLFKLKPNVQKQPRTRIDIYMPGDSALKLGVDIVTLFGAGNIAELAQIDPDEYRMGPQTLPRIDEARMVRQTFARVAIAGYVVSGGPGPVYVDRERPNEGHIEMQGPEVHIGCERYSNIGRSML